MKNERILEDIAHDFSYFLMHGELIDLTSVFTKLNIFPGKLELEKLLRIHFILYRSKNADIVNFIKTLPDELRRFNTALFKQTGIIDGNVRGYLNWQSTIQVRRSRYPDGKSAFYCEWNDREYSTPENIVLKKLIEIIDSIIKQDITIAVEKKYEWLGDWLNESLRGIPQASLLRNAYLKNVDSKSTKLTDQLIEKVARSRKKLYRDAATLYRIYMTLMTRNIDATTAVEILRTTFIKPSRESVLFEFYWIVQIMRQIKGKYGASIIPALIVQGANCIATWILTVNQQEYTCQLYHDTADGYRFCEENDISFEELPESFRIGQGNSISRMLKVETMMNYLLSREKIEKWMGRPDILLEITNNSTMARILYIGEVKYTEDVSYAAIGLKELLEYIAFAKVAITRLYIENVGKLFDISTTLRGWLFLDSSDFQIAETESHLIQVFKFGSPFNFDLAFP